MSVWLLGGTQILENTDFEVGSTYPWKVIGSSVTLSVSTADQYTGDYSALATCTSGYNPGGVIKPRFYQGEFTLEAGCTYFARCAIKVASGTIYGDGETSLKINNWSDLVTYVSKDIYVSSVWKTFGFGFTRATTVNSVKLNIYLPRVDGPPPDAGIFLDDIEIYPAVELSAGYDYKFGKVQRRVDTRDRDGGLHSYILPGGYRRFEFPGLNVDSAGRCAINSFWASGDTCYLIENDADPTSIYAVNVMEAQEAFQSFAQPYGLARYVGELKLETVDAE